MGTVEVLESDQCELPDARLQMASRLPLTAKATVSVASEVTAAVRAGGEGSAVQLRVALLVASSRRCEPSVSSTVTSELASSVLMLVALTDHPVGTAKGADWLQVDDASSRQIAFRSIEPPEERTPAKPVTPEGVASSRRIFDDVAPRSSTRGPALRHEDADVATELPTATPSWLPREQLSPSNGRPDEVTATAATALVEQPRIDDARSCEVTKGFHELRPPALVRTLSGWPEESASIVPCAEAPRLLGTRASPMGASPRDQCSPASELCATGENVRFADGKKPIVSGPADGHASTSPPLSATPFGVLSDHPEVCSLRTNSSQNVFDGSSRWPMGNVTALCSPVVLDDARESTAAQGDELTCVREVHGCSRTTTSSTTSAVTRSAHPSGRPLMNA